MQTDYPAVHLSGDQQSCSRRTSASSTRWARTCFGSFATILVVWYGVKSALSAASGRHFLPLRQLREPLLTISFGFGMVNYYSTPIPGIGTSFHNLITDEAQFLANKINQNATANRCRAQSPTSKPAWTLPVWRIFSEPPIYVVVTILLAAAQAIAIVVIAYGFIATAVCVLVGPVFIPFFIVPKLEWLFWGWFRCFIQYAFYQVIAAAVVYVIGNLILGILRPSTRRARFPPSNSLGWFPVLFITFLASIYALLKIPVAHQPHLQRHLGRLVGGNSRKGVRMNNDASFQNAKRLYLEQYGDPMVTNTYLKIALVLSPLWPSAWPSWTCRTIRTFQNFRPLVIRIDDLGRAEALNYHNFEYKPQDAEVRYFLTQFCTLYYRRNRYTIQDDFSKSLYFLDGKPREQRPRRLQEGRHHQELPHEHLSARDRH